MKASLIIGYTAILAAAAGPPPPGCAYDNCFWKDKIPSEWRPAAKTFCQALVGKQPCTTKTVTAIQTLPPTTLVRTQPPTTLLETIQSTTTIYDSVVVTISEIESTTCSTSTSAAAFTDITYPRFTPISKIKGRGVEAQDEIEYQELLKRTTLPNFVNAGCKKAAPLDKLKTACKCFLQASPAVVTGTFPSISRIGFKLTSRSNTETAWQNCYNISSRKNRHSLFDATTTDGYDNNYQHNCYDCSNLCVDVYKHSVPGDLELRSSRRHIS